MWALSGSSWAHERDPLGEQEREFQAQERQAPCPKLTESNKRKYGESVPYSNSYSKSQNL